jgi:predicted site-specific integrase-resolvase
MKLSHWAKQQGISYKTAYRMFKEDRLPFQSEQLPTGTILVHPEQPQQQQIALYARVSSSDQKEDLHRQLQRLRDYTSAQGLRVMKEVSEIGSGLNGHRKKIHALLQDQSISVIVVEHRDRLARFGVPLLESALSASGRQILVINDMEYQDDIMQDFIDLVTSMCARIYGKRAAKNKAKKALEAIKT